MTEQTPEEKLLNIIRKKDSKKESSEPVVRHTPFASKDYRETKKVTDPKKTADISDFEKNFWRDGVTKIFFLKELKNFKLERDDLLLFILLTFCIFFLNWFIGASGRSQSLDAQRPLGAAMIKNLVVTENDVDFSKKYKRALSRKDIFTALPKAKARSKPKDKGITIYDITKDLKLLGILWEDDGKPTAIIQSRKSKGTRYLKTGDNIDGADVEKIEQGRVILSYGDETADLIL